MAERSGDTAFGRGEDWEVAVNSWSVKAAIGKAPAVGFPAATVRVVTAARIAVSAPLQGSATAVQKASGAMTR